ncbi:MAG: amidase family protein, partial [Nocardioidaceae bacterium]
MTSVRDDVETQLARIDDVDQLVNAVCTINPAALDDAVALDGMEEAQRGPLWGRTVLVKDNIDTAGLLTTAGSLALAETPPEADAPMVTRLKRAGMVVLGKANLSEWANLRDEHSTSGWSAYGGLTRNPYGLNRSAGGSSAGSGAGVSARLAAFAIGTETDGSITCPAAFNGCVGLKPTVGLLPTTGIVPISASQDTPGPMALTVAETAAVLSALTDTDADYAAHATPDGLQGKRIGVPRKIFWGYNPLADAAAEHAVELLSAAGATIVDGTDLHAMVDYGFDDELLVLLAEIEAGMRDYLATRHDGPRSLADIVEFNRVHADEELSHFGQSF